jgi:hypothetical protein
MEIDTGMSLMSQTNGVMEMILSHDGREHGVFTDGMNGIDTNDL